MLFQALLVTFISLLALVLLTEIKQLLRHSVVENLIDVQSRALDYAQENENWKSSKIFDMIMSGTKEMLRVREDFSVRYIENTTPDDLDPEELDNMLENFKEEVQEELDGFEDDVNKPEELYTEFVMYTAELVSVNNMMRTILSGLSLVLAVLLDKLKPGDKFKNNDNNHHSPKTLTRYIEVGNKARRSNSKLSFGLPN